MLGGARVCWFSKMQKRVTLFISEADMLLLSTL